MRTMSDNQTSDCFTFRVISLHLRITEIFLIRFSENFINKGRQIEYQYSLTLEPYFDQIDYSNFWLSWHSGPTEHQMINVGTLLKSNQNFIG